MRQRSHLAFAFVTLLASACAPPPPDTAADEAAIRAQTEAFAPAMRSGVPDSAAGFFTEDGVMFVPNAPPVVGKPAIRAWGQQTFAAVRMVETSVSVDEVRVAGDWAVSSGTWAMKLDVGGAEVIDTTRYVLIWERQADGNWLVDRDIWNSIRPLPAPPSGR